MNQSLSFLVTQKVKAGLLKHDEARTLKVSAKTGNQTIGRGTDLPHEGQPVLSTESPTSRALWHLSLVLREIAQNLEPHGDEKQLPPQVPAEH